MPHTPLAVAPSSAPVGDVLVTRLFSSTLEQDISLHDGKDLECILNRGILQDHNTMEIPDDLDSNISAYLANNEIYENIPLLPVATDMTSPIDEIDDLFRYARSDDTTPLFASITSAGDAALPSTSVSTAADAFFTVGQSYDPPSSLIPGEGMINMDPWPAIQSLSSDPSIGNYINPYEVNVNIPYQNHIQADSFNLSSSREQRKRRSISENKAESSSRTYNKSKSHRSVSRSQRSKRATRGKSNSRSSHQSRNASSFTRSAMMESTTRTRPANVTESAAAITTVSRVEVTPTMNLTSVTSTTNAMSSHTVSVSEMICSRCSVAPIGTSIVTSNDSTIPVSLSSSTTDAVTQPDVTTTENNTEVPLFPWISYNFSYVGVLHPVTLSQPSSDTRVTEESQSVAIFDREGTFTSLGFLSNFYATTNSYSKQSYTTTSTDTITTSSPVEVNSNLSSYIIPQNVMPLSQGIVATSSPIVTNSNLSSYINPQNVMPMETNSNLSNYIIAPNAMLHSQAIVTTGSPMETNHQHSISSEIDCFTTTIDTRVAPTISAGSIKTIRKLLYRDQPRPASTNRYSSASSLSFDTPIVHDSEKPISARLSSSDATTNISQQSAFAGSTPQQLVLTEPLRQTVFDPQRQAVAVTSHLSATAPQFQDVTATHLQSETAQRRQDARNAMPDMKKAINCAESLQNFRHVVGPQSTDQTSSTVTRQNKTIHPSPTMVCPETCVQSMSPIARPPRNRMRPRSGQSSSSEGSAFRRRPSSAVQGSTFTQSSSTVTAASTSIRPSGSADSDSRSETDPTPKAKVAPPKPKNNKHMPS